MVSASLSDHDRNFADLAGVVFHCLGMSSAQLLEHLDAVQEITPSASYYGPHAAAAEIVKDTALGALRRIFDDTVVKENAYKEKRAKWQAHLEEFRRSLTVDPEDEVPENGPGILSAMCSLRDSTVSEAMYGDLQPEAEKVRQEGVANYQRVLARIALKVLDPASVPDTFDGPAEVLEMANAAFAAAPLCIEAFDGNAAMFEQAKAWHPQSMVKRAALLERTRARERSVMEGRVVSAIEQRDQTHDANARADACMSDEQKTARLQRAIEAAEPLYMLARRLTEVVVVNDQEHCGTVDGHGLKECAEQAQALFLRIEGRLN